jgi:hypothetical protein
MFGKFLRPSVATMARATGQTTRGVAKLSAAALRRQLDAVKAAITVRYHCYVLCPFSFAK